MVKMLSLNSNPILLKVFRRREFSSIFASHSIHFVPSKSGIRWTLESFKCFAVVLCISVVCTYIDLCRFVHKTLALLHMYWGTTPVAFYKKKYINSLTLHLVAISYFEKVTMYLFGPFSNSIEILLLYQTNK